MSWQEFARCRGEDPKIFWIEQVQARKGKAIKRAKKFCGDCTVRISCLDYALKNEIDEGIWGGLTAEERKDVVHIRRGDG